MVELIFIIVGILYGDGEVIENTCQIKKLSLIYSIGCRHILDQSYRINGPNI